LPRLGRIRKQALSPLWKTQVHQVFLPTRALVSSDCRMVPDQPVSDQVRLPREGAAAGFQHVG